MFRLLQLTLLTLIVVLAGCESVSVVKTGKYFDPTDSSLIEIIHIAPADGSFIELGTVTASDFPEGRELDIYAAMRQQAATLGATAVYIRELPTLNKQKKLNCVGVAIRNKPGD